MNWTDCLLGKIAAGRNPAQLGSGKNADDLARRSLHD